MPDTQKILTYVRVIDYNDAQVYSLIQSCFYYNLTLTTAADHRLTVRVSNRKWQEKHESSFWFRFLSLQNLPVQQQTHRSSLVFPIEVAALTRLKSSNKTTLFLDFLQSVKENEVKRSGTADNNKQIQKDFNLTVNCTNEHNKELTRKLSLIYDT